jgi:hypothetical protein
MVNDFKKLTKKAKFVKSKTEKEEKEFKKEELRNFNKKLISQNINQKELEIEYYNYIKNFEYKDMPIQIKDFAELNRTINTLTDKICKSDKAFGSNKKERDEQKAVYKNKNAIGIAILDILDKNLQFSFKRLPKNYNERYFSQDFKEFYKKLKELGNNKTNKKDKYFNLLKNLDILYIKNISFNTQEMAILSNNMEDNNMELVELLLEIFRTSRTVYTDFIATTELEEKLFTTIYKTEFNNNIEDIIKFKQELNKIKIGFKDLHLKDVEKIKDKLIKTKIKIDIDINLDKIIKKTPKNQLISFFKNNKISSLNLILAQKTSKNHLKALLLVSVGIKKEIQKVLLNSNNYSNKSIISFQKVNSKILENSFIPAYNYNFKEEIKILLQDSGFKNWLDVNKISIDSKYIFTKALQENENDKYNFLSTA